MPGATSTPVAVVGAGWAGRVHALAAAAAPSASPASVSATSTDSAGALAADLSLPTRRFDELPGGADAIVIATPPDTHTTLVIEAIGTGTPVMVEGPLADRLADADRIISEADARGSTVALAANSLFAPAIDALARRREGAGPLRHLAVSFHQRPPDAGYRSRSLAAGGVLLESGLQCAAVALALAGDDPVVGVKAALRSSRVDGADDVARMEMRHRSRLISVIDCSWTAEHPRWSVQAASEDRVVRAEMLPEVVLEVDGQAVDFARGEGDDLLHTLGYAAQMEGFAAALAGRGGRVCPVGFGRTLLEIAYAAYASAGRDGADVPLPYDGPRDVTPMSLWHTGSRPRATGPAAATGVGSDPDA